MTKKPLHSLASSLTSVGLIVLLAACPPSAGTDDDDSAPPVDTGSNPIITDVLVCEDPDYTGCTGSDFAVRFGITATDEDDDMNNPWWAVLINGMNPMDGYFEGNLVSGGTLNLTICSPWSRGTDLDFKLWIQDAEHNDSNDWEAVWTVPVSPGDDDCPPALR